MKPAHLPIAEVRLKGLKGLKAYNQKRLSAQGPTPRCAYRDDSNLPCVIGASLGARHARRFDLDPCSGIDALIANGFITTDDQDALKALQRAHDNWAKAHSHDKTAAEHRFKELLQP